MDEEKNILPTPKKLREARKKGIVAKSQELATALFLVGGICLIRGFASLLNGGFKEVMVLQLTSLDSERLCSSLGEAFRPLLFPVLSIMGGLLLVATSVHLFQTGLLFTKPKRGKRARRFFYPLAKAIIIAFAGTLIIRSFRTTAIDSIFLTPLQKERIYFQKTFTLALGVAIAVLLLALLDFFYQRWRFTQKMKMSKEEIKRERRESEGDPRSKAAMRARLRNKK